MVITGDGKGKTTVALGQALRAIGHGSRVAMIQFLKGRQSGEVLAAQKYLPDLDIYQYGRDTFVQPGKVDAVDIEEAGLGLKKAYEFVSDGSYDMIILDEIIMVVNLGLLPEDEFMSFIKNKPGSIDLILTGRNATQGLIERADIVSEIKSIKHYFESGMKAREGIEY